MRIRPGMIPCARATRWLYPALDGALGAREAAALGAHLERCAPCRELRDREVAFRSRLTPFRISPPPAPSALHGRLRAALAPRPSAEAPPPAGSAVPSVPSTGGERPGESARPARQVGRSLAWLAALWLVGVVLAAVLAEPLVRSRSATPALVRSVAAQQAALADRRLPLELASRSPVTVAAWLRPRLRFPVDLPPRLDDGVEIVGARLTELGAAEAAAVVYRVDGREVTLFTFPDAAIRSMEPGSRGSVELTVDGHRFQHYRLGGLTVTLWRRGEIGYALAVPAEVSAARGCAVCHEGEENRRLERALVPGLDP